MDWSYRAPKVGKEIICLFKCDGFFEFGDKYDSPCCPVRGRDSKNPIPIRHLPAHRYLTWPKVEAVSPLRWYIVKRLLNVAWSHRPNNVKESLGHRVTLRYLNSTLDGTVMEVKLRMAKTELHDLRQPEKLSWNANGA
jgi:hypothetical protein